MYEIYGLPMTNEWVYSALYNLPALVFGALTAVIAVPRIKPMRRLSKVD